MLTGRRRDMAMGAMSFSLLVGNCYSASWSSQMGSGSAIPNLVKRDNLRLFLALLHLESSNILTLILKPRHKHFLFYRNCRGIINSNNINHLFVVAN